MACRLLFGKNPDGTWVWDFVPSICCLASWPHPFSGLVSVFRNLKANGVCDEAVMPVISTAQTPIECPVMTPEITAAAYARRVLDWQKTLRSVDDVKAWLVKGHAVGAVFGGHEATIVGYDDATGCFAVLDSTDNAAASTPDGVWTDVEYSRPDLPGYVITAIQR